MRFVWVFLFIASVSSSVFGQDDGFTDENRPYKFAFNIEGYQHRSEEKDDSGIIMGQFGFVTGDGVYHVTVYATDKDGDFKIVSMKSYYIGLPGEPTTPQPPPAAPTTKNPILQHLDGLKGCSSCVIPSKKTESTPNNVPGGVPSRKPTRPGENQFNKGPGFGNGQRPQGGSKAPIGSTGIKPGNNFGDVGKPQQPGKPPGFSNVVNGGQTYKPSGGPTSGGKTPITGSKPSPIDGPSGSKTPFANPETPSKRPVSQDPNLQTGNPPKSGSPVSSGTPNPNPTKFDGLPPGMSMEDLQALLYKFNYTLRFHGHHESGYRSGDKEGGYFFNGRDGFGRDVKYIANEFGYQPNISLVELGLKSPDTPKEDTEKELNELRGNEFKWFYQR